MGVPRVVRVWGCSEDKSVRSFAGGAVNSVYDYLNLAIRSPQECINKGERVNKLGSERMLRVV